MLILVASTLILSHEESRNVLEETFQFLVPIAADHLIFLLTLTICAAISCLVLKRRSKTSRQKKQGAYGVVQTHSHSLLAQLKHPNEVFAALRFLLQKKIAKSSKNVTELESSMWDHLNATSRSFAAVIRTLPAPEVSDSVCIFYLLLRALDTIEDEMELIKFEPFKAAGETCIEAKVRLLRTFYEILDDHPNTSFPMQKITTSNIGKGAEKALLDDLPKLIEAFHMVKEKSVIKQIVLDMGNGMADYVVRDMKLGTTDLLDYNRYCHIVAGLVGKGLTEIFSNLGYEDKNLVTDFQSWNSMGLLLQKTNITRDVCEDAAESRSWWPQSVWKKNGCESLNELRDISILNTMIADCLKLVPDAFGYLDALKTNSIFIFCAIPQIMAMATLLECYNNEKVFTGVVKIRAGQAAFLMQKLNEPTLTKSRSKPGNSLANNRRNLWWR